MAETTFEPLFQINFLPEVTQVNLRFPLTEVDPNFLQASPGFTAATADVKKVIVDITRAIARDALRNFMKLS